MIDLTPEVHKIYAENLMTLHWPDDWASSIEIRECRFMLLGLMAYTGTEDEIGQDYLFCHELLQTRLDILAEQTSIFLKPQVG